MKVSPKKRAANRRNALKSTGPKTDSGRRISSLNSIRHGLSVSLPQHFAEPLQKELTELIMRNGIDGEAAHDLAQKIIEYERNILVIREKYIKDVNAFKNDVITNAVANFSPFAKEIGLDDLFVSTYEMCMRVMEMDVEESKKLKMIAPLNKVRSRLLKEKGPNTQRYFKRSSNQLIKAFKCL